MTGYILSRLLRAVTTMLATVTLVFVFIRFSGDPAAAFAPADAPQEVIDQYAKRMGLDQPFYVQYSSDLSELAQGRFGYSVHTGRPVQELFFEPLPYTLRLGLTALAIALLCGLPLGAYAAMNRGNQIDRFVMGFSVFAFAMPNFLFGLVLILVSASVFQVCLGG